MVFARFCSCLVGACKQISPLVVKILSYAKVLIFGTAECLGFGEKPFRAHPRHTWQQKMRLACLPFVAVGPCPLGSHGGSHFDICRGIGAISGFRFHKGDLQIERARHVADGVLHHVPGVGRHLRVPAPQGRAGPGPGGLERGTKTWPVKQSNDVGNMFNQLRCPNCDSTG